MVALAFNARTVEPRMGFEAIPSGWYKAMIDEVPEMKPTKKPGGAYLQCRFTILEGQFANQKVFVRLNLQNENQQAKEIAYRELSAICHAINILDLADSAQMANIPMWIKVKKRAGQAKDESNPDDKYEDSNEISSYKSINDSSMANQASGTAAAVVVPPAPGAVVVPPLAAAPVAAVAAPPVAAPPPPVAPVAPQAPARDPSYQYTPDGTMRWKAPMPAWEPVPVAAPPAPPAPAAGIPAQPWANGSIAAPPPGGAPATPPAPPAPPAPPSVTQAAPPWSPPQT